MEIIYPLIIFGTWTFFNVNSYSARNPPKLCCQYHGISYEFKIAFSNYSTSTSRQPWARFQQAVSKPQVPLFKNWIGICVMHSHGQDVGLGVQSVYNFGARLIILRTEKPRCSNLEQNAK